ncbi:O-antigen translocase [Vibrio lentus]
MNLAKTSILSFLATMIRLLSGLVINKAIAIIIGPSGLAFIGQFQNAQNMIRTFSQGGINAGVTKYTSEFSRDMSVIPEIWSASFKITLFFSVTASLIMIIFSEYLAMLIFKSKDYSYIFMLFGVTVTLSSLNQMLLSILNGLKEIKNFIRINIFQSLFSLIFTTTYIVVFGLNGALIALVTNQSIIFFVILWFLRRHSRIKLTAFLEKFSFFWGSKLASYSLMALTSSSLVPLSLILVREYIGNTLSWDDAGYWQAMNYISTMYLMVITTALSTYFLPRLSELKSGSEIKSELLNGYKLIGPIVFILTIAVYFSKELIVWVLFTDDFRSMLILFKWQLIGDFMKIISWLLAYVMLAKAMTKVYIISEISFSIVYVLASYYFIDNYGLIGASYAFAFNYTLYLFVMLFIVSNYIKKEV